MKLLVTGGAGFIGSNFIHYWFREHPEDTIVNLDKLTYAGNPENLSSIKNNPGYRFIKGDICDPAAVGEAMKGVDTVVHFAAESHVDRSILDPEGFVRTNVLGTHVLLEAAKTNNIARFHHISTDEVFGSLALGSEDRFSESTPYDPRSPYSASKASSDHLVRAYHHTYGLPITISNCSNNFGPYQHPEKLIPLAITNIMEGKQVPVYGDGKNERDWLYVEDHCRAIDAILSRGKIGETYCIGGLSDGISNLEVVKSVVSSMGADESVIRFVKDRPGHDRRYAIDWTKIQTELGWAPEAGFKEHLASTVTWYINHEAWWKDARSRDFDSYYRTQYGDRS